MNTPLLLAAFSFTFSDLAAAGSTPAALVEPAIAVALADAALKSAALLLIALLVAPLLRKTSAAARHALWAGALAAALLLPLLSLALPAWHVSWLPRWETAAAPPAADRSPLREQRDVAPPPSPERVERASPEPVETANPSLALRSPAASFRDEGVAAPSDPAADRSPLREQRASVLQTPNPAAIAAAIYFVGSLLALLPLLAGCAQAARLTRRARPLDSPAWAALLADTMHALGLRARVRLLLAPGATMPFTWGALRPAVVLPASAETWPESRRRLVLLHELGHVRRHDWLTQTLAALACALHWFNPLAWLAARRLRLEREQACDDLVLACGQPPKDYARELLDLAALSARGRLLALATVPMARPSALEARLRAILDTRRNRTAFPRAAALALAALLTAIAIPLAMLRGAATETKAPPPATQSPAAPAPAASQQPQTVTITLDSSSRYFYGDNLTPVSFPELQVRLAALAALPKDRQPVIELRSDSSVTFQALRTLMDEMQRNNLTKINLSGIPEPPPVRPPGALPFSSAGNFTRSTMDITYTLSAPPPAVLPLSIAINAAGRYISGGSLLTLAEFKPLLAEIAGKPAGKPPRVIIWAEPGAPAQALGDLQEALASLQLAPVRFGLLLTLDAAGRSFLGDNPAPLTLAELRARLNEALAKPETERTFISIRADLTAKATALQALQALTPSLGFRETSFVFTSPTDDIKAAVDAAALRPDDDTVAGWVAKVRDRPTPPAGAAPIFIPPSADLGNIRITAQRTEQDGTITRYVGEGRLTAGKLTITGDLIEVTNNGRTIIATSNTIVTNEEIGVSLPGKRAILGLDERKLTIEGAPGGSVPGGGVGSGPGAPPTGVARPPSSAPPPSASPQGNAAPASRTLLIEHRALSIATEPRLLADKDALIIGAGGTLDLGSAAVTTSATITLRDGGVLAGTGTLSAAGYVVETSATIAASLAGPGGLVISGSTSAVTLAGQNTFTGGITVKGGTLRLSTSGAAGAGSVTINSGASQIAAFAMDPNSLSQSGANSTGVLALTTDTNAILDFSLVGQLTGTPPSGSASPAGANPPAGLSTNIGGGAGTLALALPPPYPGTSPKWRFTLNGEGGTVVTKYFTLTSNQLKWITDRQLSDAGTPITASTVEFVASARSVVRLADDKMEAVADHAEISRNGTLTLNGNVVLTNLVTSVVTTGERAVFDESKGEITVELSRVSGPALRDLAPTSPAAPVPPAP